MSGRTMAFAGVMVFAAGLAVVVGLRLGESALPVALGVAIGVLVGVPLSLALAVLTGRLGLYVPGEEPQRQAPPQRASRNASSAPEPSYSGYQRPQTTEREFTVVGGAAAPPMGDDDE